MALWTMWSKKFTGETTATVRAYLRRKCNNMDYISRKHKRKTQL
ncbi:unnamed protein product [Ixodes hexagonus]